MATLFLFQASLQGDSLLLVSGVRRESWDHIQNVQHNVHAGSICYTGQKPAMFVMTKKAFSFDIGIPSSLAQSMHSTQALCVTQLSAVADR